jgi:putative copper export protein
VWLPLLVAESAAEPAATRAIEDETRRWLQVLADVLVGALIIGLLASLYVQARSTGVVFYQLFATRWGVIWLVRAALVLLACLWMESLLDDRRVLWGWGLSLALLASTALSSHSAATGGALGAVADLLHELSAAVWVGGLLLLTLSLLALRRTPLPARAQTQLAAAVVARFSGLAALGVGVLLSTGLLLGWQQVQSWSGLLLTDYGRTLSVKLILVAAALGFAAYNSLSAGRRAASGRPPGWIAAEAVLVMAAIFAAAVMTDLPPASAAGSAGSAVANDVAAPLVLASAADGWQFSTRVTPARLGSNVFELAATPPNGQSLAGASAALLFAPPGGGAPAELDLAQNSAGLFSATGAMLSQMGAWELSVRVTPASGAPAAASANLTVAVDGVARAADTPLPLTVRLVVWLNEFGRAALALLVLAGAVVWAWLAGRGLKAAKADGTLRATKER